MRTILTVTILGAALVSATTAAGAQTLQRGLGEPTNAGPVVREILLARAGLNLTTAADADIFLQRLSAGITRACDAQPGLAAPGEDRAEAFRACREGALRDAIARIHSPMVHRRSAELRLVPQMSMASR